MLLEIQLSVKNWNTFTQKLSISLLSQQEICSDKRALVRDLWVSAVPMDMHIQTCFLSLLCLFPPIDHVPSDRRERTEAAETGEKKKKGKE